MECPFLRDVKVKYCEASPFRKMILDGRSSGTERCSSPEYPQCPVAAQSLNEPQSALSAHCPFLHEANAEYCAASSVTKYIPATPALLSRCNSDGHLYCELYLSHADPQGERLPRSPRARRLGTSSDRTAVVEGVPVPTHLSYAPNHMWLDVADDGYWHVGVDAFLTRVTGTVEKITFVTSRAGDAPMAILTVGGTDLQMVFPLPMHSAAPNYYLRTDPSKLSADPYGAGWLFEALEPSAAGTRRNDAIRTRLIPGERAVAWMESEMERLTSWIHGRLAEVPVNGVAAMADGGRPAEGLASMLDREGLVNLFSDFFSPSGWRRSW